MIEKKSRTSLSSFSILLLLLIAVAIITWFVPGSEKAPIQGATLSMVAMAPFNGFVNAIDVCIFVLVLGGFLGIISSTGALDSGIKTLVKKLHGNELKLIPILMFLFSVGGTTYGMLEETTPFYLLLAATMVAAGFDSLVGASVVLLGAGSGVLGSTVNPFAVGAATSSLVDNGVSINNGIIIILGIILWLSSYAISVFFVMRYAKKVKADKGSTILSLQEQESMKESFMDKEFIADDTLTKNQKLVLVLFALTFVIMIVAFIPWGDLGVNFFEGWTNHLTGSDIGTWYFAEATTWFLIMSIIIGFAGKLSEKNFVKSFIAGAGDMMSVVLIIALARGISILMAPVDEGGTGLQYWILLNAANALQGMSAGIFAPLSYLLYCLLSFLIPSSSGLATASMPIMGPLAAELGFSPEVMIMIFVAGNGLVNLFTPTCGAIMGGFEIAKIEYSTWLKFSAKIILTIVVVSCVILTIAMVIL